jgi:EAL domain-containing protein (putative c-di-GMP-specific phosphodiesterase class I)
MLNAAERAAAQARSAPDRKVRLYEPPSAPAAIGEHEVLLNEIRDALKFDKFQLLFQPIASLQGTGEEQFQVLLRLRGEGGRLYTAAEVVPLAEKAGTINAVDRWVLSRCLMVLAERERIDRPVRLFVSQSVEAMLDPQRLPWLKQQIETRRVDAERLVLEFKYADVLARLRQAQAFLEACAPLKVRVALSSFEASMAAYQMLQHLPVHYLKVAGKYTAADGRARGELRQLVGYAHERSIRLVAPLVEDAQTAAALWATGIDFIQGDFVQQATQDLEFDFRASAN